MKMTQCKIGKVGLLANDVLFIDIDSGTEIGVEHIFEFKNVAKELAHERQVFSIINYGAYTLPTAKARELCGSINMDNQILGRALVVSDLGQMIIAKHDIKQNRPQIPTRVFTDLKKAELWVKTLRSSLEDSSTLLDGNVNFK